MGLPAPWPVPQYHFGLPEERVAPGVPPMDAHAPRAAHAPSPSKGCLAVQLTRASQLPQEHPPGSSKVIQTVVGMPRVGSQEGGPLGVTGLWTRSRSFGLAALLCMGPRQHIAWRHCLATAFVSFYLKIGIIFGKASPGLLTADWSDTKLLHTVPATASLPQAKSLWTSPRTPHTAEAHQATVRISTRSPNSSPHASAPWRSPAFSRALQSFLCI